MKQITLPLAAAIFLASPLSAEEDNRSLMEEGMRLFFKGLMSEVEPALEGLEEMARELEPMFKELTLEMGPALRSLMDNVEDWSAYHPPEMLPNGDIILRKKTAQEQAEDKTKEIDL